MQGLCLLLHAPRFRPHRLNALSEAMAESIMHLVDYLSGKRGLAPPALLLVQACG